MNTTNDIVLRDYTKIYTGTNQAGGYENPFLGFTSDSVALTIKADKSTYFHYPSTASQVYLSATDFVESGAFAGFMPFRADKIFKKCADYKTNEPWGNSIPTNMQKGVWLCAWLSGSNTDHAETPVWMDRWYNPGHFDSTLSLFVCNTSAVYDEPSKLTFDPGVLYRYDHMGSTSNTAIVNTICALKLHIDDWAEVSKDVSGYGNDAILQNYTPSMITNGIILDGETDSVLHLNGINQYASILFNPSFDVADSLTCNVWIRSANWQKSESHHYVSNGLRGGWNIGVNNGFFTPFTVLVDEDGDVVFSNQTDNFYRDLRLPGTPAPVAFAVDSELYTWILDNGVYQGNKHLYKMDYNGNIDTAVSFPTAYNLKDMTLDKNDRVWVLADQIHISAFDVYGNISQTLERSGDRLVCISNTITAFPQTLDACGSDNDIFWTIDMAGDVYYAVSGQTILALSGLSATNVKCSKDYTWVLFDTDKIIRLDKEIGQLTDEITYTPSISTTIQDITTSNITGRNLFFTNEVRNGNNSDFVWILQPNTEYLYKYDTSLNLVRKVSTNYIQNGIGTNAIKGDSSGYQWHRKFNYTNLVSGTPQIEASVYMRTNTSVLTSEKFTVSFPVTELTDNDWHMFTVSIDSDDSLIRLYADSAIKNTAPISTASSIFYKYETPLLLGSNIGRINVLDDELNKVSRIYHAGDFDDLRIYTSVLSISDIRHIYFTKCSFKDLVWNMPSGIQSYVEEIVRFFKFKMPGQKSQSYNIHLKGLQIEDVSVQSMIEDIIRDSIQKIAPMYTSLFKIIWD
jgi:hypothetical protein